MTSPSLQVSPFVALSYSDVEAGGDSISATVRMLQQFGDTNPPGVYADHAEFRHGCRAEFRAQFIRHARDPVFNRRCVEHFGRSADVRRR